MGLRPPVAAYPDQFMLVVAVPVAAPSAGR